MSNPIWDTTVLELDVDPDEPLERWRAFSDLKFLVIDIVWRYCGRGPCCLRGGHVGRCSM